jgi:hypothetical protein
VEFFNVLNRMRVCGIGQGLDNNVNDGSSQFGLINPTGSGNGTCQANTPRQGQGFFKISF